MMGMRSWFCSIQQRFSSEFQPWGIFFLSNAVIKMSSLPEDNAVFVVKFCTLQVTFSEGMQLSVSGE